MGVNQKIRVWVNRVILSGFCMLSSVSQSYADNGLVVGILPMESPVGLFQRFLPLREYLSSRLGREVSIESASDYQQHVKRTDNRRYDIVLTAPHFALRAVDGGKYNVVASFNKPLSAVVVVAEKSKLQHLKDIAARNIATPSKQAIVTMVGQSYLSEHGLKGVDQPRYRNLRTHNAAYRAVIAGDADAAIISNFTFYKAKKEGVKLKKIGESQSFPGIGVLVAKDIAVSVQQAIRQAFLELQTTPQGRALLKKISHPGYGPAKAADFESMRKYLQDSDIGSK